MKPGHNKTKNNNKKKKKTKKKTECNKLVEKLKSNNNSPKDWWKTTKGYIKPGTMQSPFKDGIKYEENIDKANWVNDYFSRQTVLDKSLPTPPSLLLVIGTHWNEYRNRHEVDETLHSLKVGKAASPDDINNKLLKQLSLSNPLSDIFIFSLAHGKSQIPGKRPISHPYVKRITHQKYLIIDQFHFLIKQAKQWKMFTNMFSFLFQRQQCNNNFTVRFCTRRFNYQSTCGHI